MEEEDHIATFLLNEPPLSPIRRVAIEQDTPHDMNQPRSIETLSQTEIETEIPTEIYSDEEGVEILQGDPVGKKKEPIEGDHQNQVVQPNSTNTANAIEEEVKGDDSKRVTRTCMMTVGKYFRSINDFVNLEKTCKEYRGITEQYRFNPVPFKNEKEREAFKYIETYHLYEGYDPQSAQIGTVLNGNAKIKKIIIHEDDDKLDDRKYKGVKGNDKVKFEVSKTGKFKFDMDPSISVLIGVDDNISDNPEVKEIVIPYHITKIRENCFSCGLEEEEGVYGRDFGEGLKDIFIPNSVSVICPRSFFDCGITSVHIPSSITFIPEGCFAKCKRLESIHLPNTIKFLGDNAFSNCTKLKSITLPSSVTSLGNECFKECYSLSNVIITSNLVSIGDECFVHDDIKHFYSVDQDLTPYSVDLPSTLTYLGKYIFCQCDKITSVRCDIPIIPFSCFCGCDELRSVRLSYRVTEIRACAFQGCMNLKSIYLPSGLKRIGWSTFQYCHELSFVHIPSTLTYLGEDCFKDCDLNPINLPSNLQGVISEKSIKSMEGKIRWVSPDGSDIELTKEKKDSA